MSKPNDSSNSPKIPRWLQKAMDEDPKTELLWGRFFQHIEETRKGREPCPIFGDMSEEITFTQEESEEIASMVFFAMGWPIR